MTSPEILHQRNFVDFSKCQMEKIIEAYQAGKPIEIEFFSPYLEDYDQKTGEIWKNNLRASDHIGIEIGKVLRAYFPKARVISLYDEYNRVSFRITAEGKAVPGEAQEFPEEVKQRFRTEIENLLKTRGIIQNQDQEGENYLFISESSKIKAAEKLTQILEEKGWIQKEGETIFFVNPKTGNKIKLRNAQGRWLCAALDASSYLDPKNLEITHLVVLSNDFKNQQDQVWEILNTLGIEPENYHNIYFDEKGDAEAIAGSIQKEIENATH